MAVNKLQTNVQAISNNGGKPLVCTPLIGRDTQELINEIEILVEKQPDVIEWRADFYARLSETEKVLETAQLLKEKAVGIPLLFTIRSEREGGEVISLSEDEKVKLLITLCEKKSVEAIDYELMNDLKHMKQVSTAAKANGLSLIVSYHHFQETPDNEKMVRILTNAESVGADIAKIAVMPQSLEDALRLLSATLQAKKQIDVPIISMAMGEYGAFTRMVGGLFGSVMTFAIGKESSAPGQVELTDLHAVLSVVHSKNID
ncbi:type I 3-dehydroquinate dehydratase [Bacillus sp. NPDC077027]|uniref:type I 3-dehydroquinate dehydratase n=1 Tax=Bacillus sp. NPDC077027 TaxID=3390548 RepID=UPI003D01BEA8